MYELMNVCRKQGQLLSVSSWKCLARSTDWKRAAQRSAEQQMGRVESD